MGWWSSSLKISAMHIPKYVNKVAACSCFVKEKEDELEKD